jgi:hypothetical protein
MPLSSTGRERLPPNEIKALSHISRLFNFIFIRNKHVVLDIIERVFLLILYGRFAVRMILSLDASPNLATLLLIVSEGLPIIIIAVRGWSNTISDKPFDWVLAFMGATVPLLSAPGNASAVIPQQFAVLIMLTGTFVQISAKVILWRSFGIVPANRGLKIAGPYRFIRVCRLYDRSHWVSAGSSLFVEHHYLFFGTCPADCQIVDRGTLIELRSRLSGILGPSAFSALPRCILSEGSATSIKFHMGSL